MNHAPNHLQPCWPVPQAVDPSAVAMAQSVQRQSNWSNQFTTYYFQPNVPLHQEPQEPMVPVLQEELHEENHVPHPVMGFHPNFAPNMQEAPIREYFIQPPQFPNDGNVIAQQVRNEAPFIAAAVQYHNMQEAPTPPQFLQPPPLPVEVAQQARIDGRPYRMPPPAVAEQFHGMDRDANVPPNMQEAPTLPQFHQPPPLPLEVVQQVRVDDHPYRMAPPAAAEQHHVMDRELNVPPNMQEAPIPPRFLQPPPLPVEVAQPVRIDGRPYPMAPPAAVEQHHGMDRGANVPPNMQEAPTLPRFHQPPPSPVEVAQQMRIDGRPNPMAPPAAVEQYHGMDREANVPPNMQEAPVHEHLIQPLPLPIAPPFMAPTHAVFARPLPNERRVQYPPQSVCGSCHQPLFGPTYDPIELSFHPFYPPPDLRHEAAAIGDLERSRSPTLAASQTMSIGSSADMSDFGHSDLRGEVERPGDDAASDQHDIGGNLEHENIVPIVRQVAAESVGTAAEVIRGEAGTPADDGQPGDYPAAHVHRGTDGNLEDRNVVPLVHQEVVESVGTAAEVIRGEADRPANEGEPREYAAADVHRGTDGNLEDRNDVPLVRQDTADNVRTVVTHVAQGEAERPANDGEPGDDAASDQHGIGGNLEQRNVVPLLCQEVAESVGTAAAGVLQGEAGKAADDGQPGNYAAAHVQGGSDGNIEDKNVVPLVCQDTADNATTVAVEAIQVEAEKQGDDAESVQHGIGGRNVNPLVHQEVAENVGTVVTHVAQGKPERPANDGEPGDCAPADVQRGTGGYQDMNVVPIVPQEIAENARTVVVKAMHEAEVEVNGSRLASELAPADGAPENKSNVRVDAEHPGDSGATPEKRLEDRERQADAVFPVTPAADLAGVSSAAGQEVETPILSGPSNAEPITADKLADKPPGVSSAPRTKAPIPKKAAKTRKSKKSKKNEEDEMTDDQLMNILIAQNMETAQERAEIEAKRKEEETLKRREKMEQMKEQRAQAVRKELDERHEMMHKKFLAVFNKKKKEAEESSSSGDGRHDLEDAFGADIFLETIFVPAPLASPESDGGCTRLFTPLFEGSQKRAKEQNSQDDPQAEQRPPSEHGTTVQGSTSLQPGSQ